MKKKKSKIKKELFLNSKIEDLDKKQTGKEFLKTSCIGGI